MCCDIIQHTAITRKFYTTSLYLWLRPREPLERETLDYHMVLQLCIEGFFYSCELLVREFIGIITNSHLADFEELHQKWVRSVYTVLGRTIWLSIRNIYKILCSGRKLERVIRIVLIQDRFSDLVNYENWCIWVCLLANFIVITKIIHGRFT